MAFQDYILTHLAAEQQLMKYFYPEYQWEALTRVKIQRIFPVYKRPVRKTHYHDSDAIVGMPATTNIISLAGNHSVCDSLWCGLRHTEQYTTVNVLLCLTLQFHTRGPLKSAVLCPAG